MSKVMSTTEAANRKVTRRAISSPSRRRAKKEREPTAGPALGTVVLVAAMWRRSRLLDPVECLGLLDDDFFWKLCVGERLDQVLSVGDSPLYEALDGITFGGIGELGRNQQPGKAGDRIGSLAGGVGDGNAEIIGHVFGGSRSRRGDAREIGLDEFAGGVSNFAIRHLVLDGVNQFHVAEGVRRLLNEA